MLNAVDGSEDHLIRVQFLKFVGATNAYNRVQGLKIGWAGKHSNVNATDFNF